ncbi:uncharacterized protein [Procambarus clarkii]|uniref:uncharacterized protein n=1 Tax=Procambarus clarkii TaxID=6728 RepID=UPI003742D817
MAEEYILTHRPSARYVPKAYSRYPVKHKPEDRTAPRSVAKSTSDSPRRISPKRDVLCWTCGKRGHIAAKCRSSSGNNPRREVMLMSSIVPPTSTLEKRKGLFAPYSSQGYVASGLSSTPVVILKRQWSGPVSNSGTSLPEGISADEMQKVILGGFPSTLYVAHWLRVAIHQSHPVQMPVPEHWTRAHLIEEQKKDPQIANLGIRQVTSSAYHPKSQGALERFHQTLKGMLRKFCYDRQSKWVEELPYLLFAAKLTHVAEGHQSSLLQMIREYKPIFEDVPGLTSVLRHDVKLEEGVRPIKQHPYRLNPLKKRVVKEEVDYMLKHHLIAPSSSPWSSPILLVPKPGKKYRLCIDYRQVNKVTVADTYPLPRVEECLDAIGKARYLTKFDLFKGYWQVPLTKKGQTHISICDSRRAV